MAHVRTSRGYPFAPASTRVTSRVPEDPEGVAKARGRHGLLTAMTATDTTLRPAAHPGRLRMLNHLRRLAAAGPVEPPCARQQHQADETGNAGAAEDAEDAEAWDDFRHRLA